jgi:hypothetical protein
MYVIFWFPLALGVVGTVFYFLYAEVGLFWKLIMTALTVSSVVLQFAPAFSEVHFGVPLGMQLVVCLWVALYFQLE